MNKNLFIGLLFPAFLITNSVLPSGNETEKTPQPEKTETVTPQEETKNTKTAKRSDDFWEDFDSFFDFEFPRIEFPRIEWKKRADLIHEKETVALPDIEIKLSDDQQSLMVMIKGLQAKKDEINVELFENKGYATFKFPFNEAKVSMQLWNDELAMSGVKTITQEKKDEKGKVLSSSSYKGYNSFARSLPKRIQLSSLKKNHPQFKDGILTLTFDLQETKERIAVE